MRLALSLLAVVLTAAPAFAANPVNDVYTFRPENVLDLAMMANEPEAGIDSVVPSSGQGIKKPGHCGNNFRDLIVD